MSFRVQKSVLVLHKYRRAESQREGRVEGEDERERPAMEICKVSLKHAVTKNPCTYTTKLSLGNEPHEISRGISGAHAKSGIVSTSTNPSGKHHNSRESRAVFPQ